MASSHIRVSSFIASSNEITLKVTNGVPKEWWLLPSRCMAFLAVYTIDFRNNYFFRILLDLLSSSMAGFLLLILSPCGAGCNALSISFIYLLPTKATCQILGYSRFKLNLFHSD